MRVVVAPQEFKGSLTAREAAAAIADGVRDALPDAVIDVVPMSDGGAGLVEAMLAARGGDLVTSSVHDPLMRPIAAAWGLVAPGGTAAIEMAAASGLVLLSAAERDPLAATTFGTGELIRAALERGCPQIIVGVGGSATVDGGAGAMQALGARLLDAHGRELPPGGGPLERLDRIDASTRAPRLAATEMLVACDVTNQLCGPRGAAAIFGPQKGASPAAVATLDAALRHLAAVVERDLGVDVVETAGGGAAGGLAAGLMAFAGATIAPGFDLVASAVGLEAKIVGADIVLTGEGRLDAQTAFGKTAAGVARMARVRGKPVAVVAGTIEAGYEAPDLFDVMESAASTGVPLDAAMRDAALLARAAAARAVRMLVDGP
jgi:glycerate kinase